MKRKPFHKSPLLAPSSPQARLIWVIRSSCSAIHTNAPTATGDSASTPESKAVTINVLANDSDDNSADNAALKAIFFDGNGLCLFYKRLDKGNFQLPEPRHEGELTVVLEERELDDLLAGLVLEQPARKTRSKVH